MGSYIKVSVPRMEETGERLHTGIDKIPQFIHELDEAMKNLGACWSGPAWIGFQQQVESDILNMLDVYNWMREFLETMSQAEKVYGDCEKNSYNQIDRVRI